MIVASQIFQPDFKENDAELLGCVLHTIILHPFFSQTGVGTGSGRGTAMRWRRRREASQGTCEGQGPSIRKRCVKLFGTA